MRGSNLLGCLSVSAFRVGENLISSAKRIRGPLNLQAAKIGKGINAACSLVCTVDVETYTRLTYVECTGEQYINTGYVVQEDDVIEMYYISTSLTSDEKALFGAYDGNGSIWYLLYSNTAYIRYGSSSSVSVSNARQRYHVKIQKGSVYIDGNTTDLSYVQMPSVPLYLFARNGNNSAVEMYGYCKSLGFRIVKTSGEMVMNLKPCKRDSDGAIGMLDLVTGKFFGNNGSGEDFCRWFRG